MNAFASFNFAIVEAGTAFIPAAASAALYGKGIFTTVAIYDGKPFLLDKHWRRLQTEAQKLAIDLSQFSDDKTSRALIELIEKNKVKNGRARLTFFDESAGELWPYSAKHRTTLLIMTDDLRVAARSMRLTISPHTLNSTSLLSGVKSCNYLEKILTLREVKESGFDEGIQLNERGEIVSACLANIFWLKDETLFTPALTTGCLAGTTREFVIESLECEETVADSDVLAEADEIFLTSSGLGIIQIDELDGRHLSGHPHLITTLISRHLAGKKIHETAR